MIQLQVTTTLGEPLYLLGLNGNEVLELIQGMVLEVPMERFGMEGILFVGSRPTDQMIAQDLMTYLENF